MKNILVILLFVPFNLFAQVKWDNVDSMYGPIPKGFHVFKTTESLDGKPFIAYYAIADLKERSLGFTVDTSFNRRLTPTQFFEKNDHPLLVVNSTFFSFETNRNLNVVIKDGKVVAHNQHSIPLKGKDTLMYGHAFAGAFGISKKRNADVAWIFTDSSENYAYASQYAKPFEKDSVKVFPLSRANTRPLMEVICNHCKKTPKKYNGHLDKWKIETAVGGGPVLVQQGNVNITNDAENRFSGKAIKDKHPRTLIGYTTDQKVIVMVIQGRFPGIAEGATLEQEAKLMVELGCVEALNLDGGGSSCMLINGKQTIVPSDKQGTERAVPAVFLIMNN